MKKVRATSEINGKDDDEQIQKKKKKIAHLQ
jgi:hypothetical protein